MSEVTPRDREEKLLAAIAEGATGKLPTPRNRKEKLLKEIYDNGGTGGGGVTPAQVKTILLDNTDTALNGASSNPIANKALVAALADYVKSTDLSIPTKVSELINDKKYQTDSDLVTALTPYAKSDDVTAEIIAEIAKVVADAPEDFDTLKEMSDWIAGHEDDASAMNSAIQTNKSDIATLQTSKADKSEIPTTIAELTDSSDYAKKTDVPTALPANGGNADTVNNHTVKSNVPENAVFTDTIYDDTELNAKLDELINDTKVTTTNTFSSDKIRAITNEIKKFTLSKTDYQGIEVYPTECGVYRVTEKIDGIPNDASNYATLIIYGNGYFTHIYHDVFGRMWIGFTDNSIKAPTWRELETENTINHNIPRVVPKDITSYMSDGSFYKRLNGTEGYELFEDIFVGDYIKMSRAISAPNQDSSVETIGSQYVTIIGLDTLMSNGDRNNLVNYHHAVMTPGQGFGGTQHFGKHRMNSTNTTEGGYVASEMNTAVIGAVATSGSTTDTATINQQLYAEFGSHLATTRELVTNSINATGTNRLGDASGCSNNCEWASMQAILMSEIEVYGSIAFSSSGFDTGNAKMQMPLFTHNRQAMNNRSAWYWLKDIASAKSFCNCGGDGNVNHNSAISVGPGVRPRFVIKA